jgi:hypothetical protein
VEAHFINRTIDSFLPYIYHELQLCCDVVFYVMLHASGVMLLLMYSEHC